MQQEVVTHKASVPADLQEKVLLGGDLSRLTPGERLAYYNAVCTSVGLNPLTRPFEYLALQGKLILYARKDCTDQLRDLPDNQISVELVDRQVVDGVYVVTARAKNLVGRTDESVGAVSVPASPSDKANAMMKAETKAKRRVTLSICGLGMLDETELETISGADPIPYHQPPEKAAADGAGTLEQVIPQQASDAQASSGDPAEPHRAKLRTCERTNNGINRAYHAIPETLRQDCFAEYTAQLKSIGNKRKQVP
jgi:hypothetical protein